MSIEVFLRIRDVMRVTGLPRSTIFEMVTKDKFPKQLRLSPRAVGWRESEILDWQRARIAERDLAPERPSKRTKAAESRP